jgi:hypothetical protein
MSEEQAKQLLASVQMIEAILLGFLGAVVVGAICTLFS